MDELSLLLDRDPAEVRRSAVTLFDRLVTPGKPLVLFGAGGLGTRVARSARRLGLTIVAFADNNRALHGKKIEGLEVLSAAEAVRRHGSAAVFLVAVYVRGAAVRKQLESLGAVETCPFYPLFWKHPQEYLPHWVYDQPHKVIEAKQDLVDAARLLVDEESRREYTAQVRFRLDPGETAPPPPSRQPIYFPTDIVRLGSDETFVDCGGYGGDTLQAFLAACQSRFRRIVVFEPDPSSFARLENVVSALPEEIASRIDLRRSALGEKPGTVRFSQHGLASTISADGEVEVPCQALDSALRHERSTFIKMDIEGAELEALRGATAQIREHRPLLAVSLYHRQDDLWRIPLFIRSLDERYRFFLRRYNPEMVDDLVLYAVSSRNEA